MKIRTEPSTTAPRRTACHAISSLIAKTVTAFIQTSRNLNIKIGQNAQRTTSTDVSGTYSYWRYRCDTRLEADYIYAQRTKLAGSVVARKALEITGSATLLGDASYDEVMDIHPRARMRGRLNTVATWTPLKIRSRFR
jgi:hemolysin activation/secretion protein